jgi:hypothetical protein
MRRPGGRPGMFMSPLEAADETHHMAEELLGGDYLQAAESWFYGP